MGTERRERRRTVGDERPAPRVPDGEHQREGGDHQSAREEHNHVGVAARVLNRALVELRAEPAVRVLEVLYRLVPARSTRAPHD